MSFSHLHVHSHYSLLQALPKIPDLIATAKRYEYKTLALTDSGNLYGAIEFYKDCKKAGIKPIIGADTFVAPRTRFDKVAGIDKPRNRLILLAKDYEGYRNLLKIVTASYLEGFYYRPRVDFDLLRKHSSDLFAIMPSWNSDLGYNLRSGRDTASLIKILGKYRDIYADSLFQEVIFRGNPEVDKAEAKLLEFCMSNGVEATAGSDVYYLEPGDKEALRTLQAINQHGERQEITEDLSFKSEDTIRTLTEIGLRELGNNTLARSIQTKLFENNELIAGGCDLELTIGKWVFPNLILDHGDNYDDELRKLAFDGIGKRGLAENEQVIDRLNYELQIIKNKGYSPYFLVVADLLHYAHDHGILTTIRGSVAGSLVTYCCGITNLDPLYYKLPFERFLNPERPSAPDIDMDYASNRREEMIAYAKQKYGIDHVAQIGTFGTMAARGSVRDTARALGFPLELADRIAKLIPIGSQGFPMTIDRALEDEPDLRKLYDSDDDVHTIIDRARKIEGCARQIGVHAAGVVISPTPLTDFSPLQLDAKGENTIITQYDMHSVEDAGLLKFDFLGLKNLAILASAITQVKHELGEDVDIERIPIDDEATFKLLAKGETIGLFQLNGVEMTRFLKELKPTTIHDINAMVALFRPGPMESIPTYIERKHNPNKVRYLDPRMKDILTASYGVITYQDDVMLIAIHLAGYSWLEADMLRKAMGKKIPAVMAAEKEKLVSGLLENGMSHDKTDELWKLIEPFAAYGFNKAHAASYGRVAYQTAYMKTHYGALYMAAILSADAGDNERIAESIAECKRMGIMVLPPDINESDTDFRAVRNDAGEFKTIRFGLTTIRNFGEAVGRAIISERNERGPFSSIEEFLTRIHSNQLNKKSIEALIKSGALDRFINSWEERGHMLDNIEKLLEFNKEARATKEQSTLFGSLTTSGSSLRLVRSEKTEFSKRDLLSFEKEFLGLYLSSHPLENYRDKLEGKPINIKSIIESKKNHDTVVVGGVLDGSKIITTKKGDKMLVATLVDLEASIPITFFPSVYSEVRSILHDDSGYVVKAKINLRDNVKNLIVNKIRAM